MLSRELQITLNLAITEARNRRHEYLTLEHVLYAMLHDPVALEVLQACGVDPEQVKEDLEAFFEESFEVLPEGALEDGPEQTLAFQRSIQRAAYHVQSSGKKELDAGSLLVSMMRESDSQAVYLLEKQGVSRLDLMNFVSHGIRKSNSPRVIGESDSEEDTSAGGNPKASAKSWWQRQRKGKSTH